MSQAKRGPIVPLAPKKTGLTIRIDTELLDWFREQVDRVGGGKHPTSQKNVGK